MLQGERLYQSYTFLEIRVLILSDEKAFCSCKAGSSAEHCPICTCTPGHPPLLKESIARDAYRLAQSLGCTLIQKAQYEYPSGMPALPPEYQLCGASVKIAEKGALDIEFHKHKKQIDILEIRIEEDAGRLMHADGKTFMDYSSAGMPSIRIRTGNNLELGEEAEMFLTELNNRMRYIGLLTDSDSIHKIRCNAYVASTEFPNPPQHYVKLRNLNSFNFVRKAVNEDLRRQEEMLKQGEEPISESRLWNARMERTEPYKLRDFIDYVKTKPVKERHFYTAPESLLQEVLHTAPENQESRKLRYIRSLGLSIPIVRALCAEARVADFFEAVLQFGTEPKTAANGILEDILPLLKRAGKTIDSLILPPEFFARIVRLSQEGTINHPIIRTLLQKIIIGGADPTTLLAQDDWIKISDETTLRTLVQEMLAKHPKESELLKAGSMKYLEILCGEVMKRTKGFADQQLVKQIIKEELNIRIIYVLPMGGAISGKIQNGQVESGNTKILSELLDSDIAKRHIRIEPSIVDGLFSEELEPADWARLIHTICEKIASGTANGIVVTHGTDSLVYTAPLIYWLFAGTPVSIVLTASATAPSESEEARRNFNDAVKLAWEKENGVYVSFNGKVLSPLNLKFVDSAGTGFVNWNMQTPLFRGEGLLSDYTESDSLVFESLLSEAADNMFLIKTYPGIRSGWLLSFLQKDDIRTFFLELYGNGTANMKDSPYSLKEFLKRGKKRQCRFYCTSQQEEVIDFSGYASARNLWKEGAVPMGGLTTETAIALYYAASLVCDTQEELDHIMETAALLNEK
ncbi:aspartyl/glutamyl-tRNA(Asn/Gln) amidotransferase, B subunit [Treponema vincentii F0403]|uniref:Aspartyl/glutamyl-tRNA(Asn/Gln) amidotransferase, B subunit n=1 Tax=Treponema vincentii F0403 TaxID=1125702 RepID=S3MBJ2_9SPIR|nr:aspartyl/glutamyl-tRNA(Asn/Gln) amidotransferase, B subunit [Treponema vincentii F0403]